MLDMATMTRVSPGLHLLHLAVLYMAHRVYKGFRGVLYELEFSAGGVSH